MTRRRSRREDGFTMVELLVTVVVMGVAFVVLVGGLGVASIGSDVHSRQATAQAVLRSVVEAVKSAEQTTYVECASSYPVPESIVVPAGYVVSPPTVVGRWDPAPNQFVLGSCGIADSGLQLVEVQVTAEARPVTERLRVVKRRP